MNLNSKKLTIPDLISVGVFTAIYLLMCDKEVIEV